MRFLVDFLGDFDLVECWQKVEFGDVPPTCESIKIECIALTYYTAQRQEEFVDRASIEKTTG